MGSLPKTDYYTILEDIKHQTLIPTDYINLVVKFDHSTSSADKTEIQTWKQMNRLDLVYKGFHNFSNRHCKED